MMSFANEYIQKYGQKAIQAYKRSLNHADSSDSPRLQPKHPTNRSKSCKSITSKSKKKNHSSKSILNLHGNKSKPTSMNQAFSNIQLNLGINQPQRKKLIISDMNTPKNNTPNKVLLLNKSRPQSKLQGISTNVNVYVQAVNRSKSKQSTPGTGVHNSRQNSTHKKGDMECQMVRQILGLLQQQQGRRQSRNIKLAKEKLTVLMKNLEVKDRQFQRMEKKFAKMRNIVGKSNKNSMIFSDERERQMQQKVHQLQNQLSKYKQKEKTLLRIVQTLSASKQVQRKMDDSESQHHNQDMND